ncbi:hypothetical protein AVEN_112605-1 [Araneus ventricosus]|uniref:RUN domain-containing protein n=1 Tax=Araneus ventricosus TaxID=182803 RepID=A0A4Y2MHD7_ARAVE|nr:hypothetical protein AVEN_112605-1 [Araneus ventricosus]
MSVSHPLLKQLKGHVYELRKDAQTEVRDHHPTMLPLCHTLEEIFQAGLKTKLNTPFGLMRKDYWFWVQFLYEQRDKYRMPFALVEAIESVQNSKKVHTNLGRGRLFIRTALVKKVLPNVLKLLLIDEIFLFVRSAMRSSLSCREATMEPMVLADEDDDASNPFTVKHTISPELIQAIQMKQDEGKRCAQLRLF